MQIIAQQGEKVNIKTHQSPPVQPPRASRQNHRSHVP